MVPFFQCNRDLSKFIPIIAVLSLGISSTDSKAYDTVMESKCSFMTRPNSAPIWNDHRCEIINSVGQGEYYFEITFNSQRKYIAEGSWNDGRAKLNGRKAKETQVDKFECWETNDPYLKVCMEQYF
jgi:hypothetical protein